MVSETGNRTVSLSPPPSASRSPSPPISNTRSHPAPYKRAEEVDIFQGRILWLPTLKRLPSTDPTRPNRSTTSTSPMRKYAESGTQRPDPHTFNHTILILSYPANDAANIHFVTLTTLGSRTLLEKFKHLGQKRQRGSYIPVAPSGPHPDYPKDGLHDLLTFEHGLQMARRGFLCAQHVYHMPWALAENYGDDKAGRSTGRVWQLDHSSLERVLKLVRKLTDYRPGPQVQRLIPRPMPTTKERRDSSMDDAEDVGVPFVATAVSFAAIVAARAAATTTEEVFGGCGQLPSSRWMMLRRSLLQVSV